MLSVIMLSVIMLSVIMLSVIMLNVIMLSVKAPMWMLLKFWLPSPISFFHSEEQKTQVKHIFKQIETVTL